MELENWCFRGDGSGGGVLGFGRGMVRWMRQCS